MFFKIFRNECKQVEKNLGMKLNLANKITAFILVKQAGRIMFFIFLGFIGFLINWIMMGL